MAQPNTNGSSHDSAERCAAACNADAGCTSFQLGTAATEGKTNCIVWRGGACDGPAGRAGGNSTDPSVWGTAAGASLGVLYRKVDGGEGTLPVATPGNDTDAINEKTDGVSVCFAKCDSAWCNDHGSAHVDSDGRCACTCFTALGWVGHRCDECGGPQPFFPVRSSGGGIVNCTLCTNAGHCSGRAKSVTANAARPGCDCDCVQGYAGRDCSECAAGFNRSDSNQCQLRQAPCMVHPSRGDPRGANVTCAVNRSVDPEVSCTWIRTEGFVCSPNLQTSVCGDTSFGLPPYCRHSCAGLSEHDCVASDTPWCHLVRTDEDIECATN
eukprot:gene19344-biopygen31058